MRPTAAFLDLVRSIDSGNAPTQLETLAALLTAEPPSGPRASATLRHLEALGFRLEGGGRFGDAARAYELAAAIDPHDPQRWRRIANTARLRDLIGQERWDDASAFVAEIRGGTRQQPRRCCNSAGITSAAAARNPPSSATGSPTNSTAAMPASRPWTGTASAKKSGTCGSCR
ncbi:hypothetical protein [Methylobacterium sp. DCY52]|uniref:hypothetical protein n=1 Tax=Methylobacterium sp. DCY52 TaxID=739139 RepID=UPI003144ECE3